MADTNKPNILHLSGNLSEMWRRFIQNFNIYMIIRKNHRKSKAAILRNLVGEEAVKCARCLNCTAGQGKTCHMNNFNCIQENRVSKNYLNKSGVPADKITRDCVFMGVRDSALQQEMLRTQDLTLEKACELGRLAETSTQQLHCLRGEIKKTVISESTVPVSVNALISSKKNGAGLNRQNKEENTVKCKQCNYTHSWNKCPAYGKQCHKCGKLNHVASMC
ncbi:hypothetical protein PR048_013055 [Dryococelus australis]|uniref:CCHC-type domain-containing protein n=1 Tax=Dryococelus australis TaxID=614101 RepID=A0ABQ9HR36_9NEOP|nr:hypothetical protein PR048_013055 [Dryococelus australis]